jgi:DNA-binding GntR family transcriptional regulator
MLADRGAVVSISSQDRETGDEQMRRSKRVDNAKVILLKDTVAKRLCVEIVKGRLRPVEKIVEGGWARTFGVSQASIREAIKILVKDGLVTKAQGRSARVGGFILAYVSYLKMHTWSNKHTSC